MNILIIEDDAPHRQLLKLFLEQQGHTVREADSGNTGLERLDACDLVLLDVQLPDTDGFSLLAQLRQQRSELPALFISNVSDPEIRIRALELGADDYLIKPLDLRELSARIQSVMRRYGFKQEIRHGPLVIRPLTHEVWYGKTPVDLLNQEFALLVTLARHPERVWTRQELLERAWGTDYMGTERTVDVRVSNLRKKLQLAGSATDYIRSIRGVGYCFRAQSV
ncbi:DNA-binding response OmpR family regulator [Deinobacterium chartae]|uniref:DNA-binding response OmpR family regulator n=1 Tax=Deinobacterium chartae TaxID=521158 RepID=A0A841I0R5_9DEIO|nr:response regulator transcription factor [Deinobacterium chartae]MBB6097858.1 DNA-binding response OmpR family regulator [Deinobacterium chartae]